VIGLGFLPVSGFLFCWFWPVLALFGSFGVQSLIWLWDRMEYTAPLVGVIQDAPGVSFCLLLASFDNLRSGSFLIIQTAVDEASLSFSDSRHFGPFLSPF